MDGFIVDRSINAYFQRFFVVERRQERIIWTQNLTSSFAELLHRAEAKPEAKAEASATAAALGLALALAVALAFKSISYHAQWINAVQSVNASINC